MSNLITAHLLRIGICAPLLLPLATGCVSRYRLDLYVASEGITKKVKVEQTQFIEGTTLSDPYGDAKIVAGAGNTVIVTMGTRWGRGRPDSPRLFSFDEYWKSHLYLQVTRPVETGRCEVRDRSFVRTLGRYDLNQEDKVFLPSSGYFAVDSVTTKHVFITIDSEYENRSGQPLRLSGAFKVKIAQ